MRPVRFDLALPLQTALHTGRSVGADANLDQVRQERQKAGQDGEAGPEVEIAEGEGCKRRGILHGNGLMAKLNVFPRGQMTGSRNPLISAYGA